MFLATLEENTIQVFFTLQMLVNARSSETQTNLLVKWGIINLYFSVSQSTISFYVI